MTNGLKIGLVLAMLAGLSWAMYECNYYYSYYADLRDRPWAYSRDDNAKLLVGTWQGEFRDPNGIQKTIRLDILLPTTDDERAKKASRRARRRSGLGSRTDKRHFDGTATVTSLRGTEEYEINGWVDENDWHRLRSVHTRVLDEQRQLRKSFTLNGATDGQWQDDQLTLTVGFTYTTATGSGYSDSADPRYDRKVTIRFIRVKS